MNRDINSASKDDLINEILGYLAVRGRNNNSDDIRNFAKNSIERLIEILSSSYGVDVSVDEASDPLLPKIDIYSNGELVISHNVAAVNPFKVDNLERYIASNLG
ncbi:MAG: hypothetical protein WCK96_18500 [Methylococcales bacterium]